MTKTGLLKLIRQNCLKCCGGQIKEVEGCTCGPRPDDAGNLKYYPFTCVLWPYRFGTDPNRKPPTKEAVDRIRAIGSKYGYKKRNTQISDVETPLGEQMGGE
jgi:hypothetical protein